MPVSGAADALAAVAAARAVFPLLALAGLWLLARRGRPGHVLAGVVAAGVFGWAISTLPLARPYAAGPSHDRLGNLAMAQVVAAGNPAWQTPQPGQLAFEPFWGLFAAAASGFDPDRLLAIYDRLPLIALIGFPLALWRLLAPLAAWERAVAVAFTALLCASPFDFFGSYRSPWAMTFLLKPNHALGLIVFPIVLDRIARARGARDALVAGLWLHLLAWVFVIHMAYVALGLVLFAAASLAARREGARADARDVLIAVGVNVAVASPYLLTLIFTYPFLSPGGWRMQIPANSPHLLEVTARTGALFLLALWGGNVLFRRGDRLSRLLAWQAAGAYLFWAFYIVLGALQHARERDEIYYWTRFWEALLAGVGAWDLAGRFAQRAEAARLPAAWAAVLAAARPRAALLLALALPWSVPHFWNPPRMDQYFAPSLEPVPELYRAPTDFLRHQTAPTAVVAGDPQYARWTAGLGARRVLVGYFLHNPRDTHDRLAFEKALVAGGDAEVVASGQKRWGVSHLLVTPTFLAEQGVSLDALRSRRDLRQVHFTGDPAGAFVAVFEIKSS